jgi:DNA polymerase I-like protein with 3'-5' exonuclease and polymerase domains
MIKKDYRIVDESNYDEFFSKLKSYGYIAYDVETTGLNVRKDNVIGFSICGEAGLAYYYPLYSWNGVKLQAHEFNLTRDHEVLYEIKKKELLTWNGSFDVRITKSNFNIDLTDSIVADGMLLKHTLKEDGPFGLKPTGIELQHLIGLNVEEDANAEQIELKENIKKNGGSVTKTNYEMYKADLAVLGKYGAADADLTFRICEYYLQELEKEGLQKFFFDDEVMPLYKSVTIPMEMLGVKLDLDLINEEDKNIQQDIANLQTEIETELYKTQEVKNYLNDQVLACCEVGKVGTFVQEYIKLFNIPAPKSEKTQKYLTSKVDLSGIDSLTEEQVYTIKKSVFESKPELHLNIFSKKQMGEIVFNYMNIEPLSETAKGSPQFNDDMIEWLANNGHSWASKLQDYNKLIKIKGSYIDRFLEGQENGRYYFSYKQHGTISGRYGSDAQQMPRPQEDGSPVVLKYLNNIRKYFIAEPNRVFIDCDYESLEPHIFAHVSGDEGLRDIFRKNLDFYSTIAIATEKLHQYSPNKKDSNYLGTANKPKRQSAKTYSLGIPYGMGGYALGKNLDIPTEEAEELVEGYLSAYPELKRWMEDSKQKAQELGYIRSELGRVRHLPKVKEIYNKFGDSLLNFKFRNKLGTKMPKEYVFNMYMDYKNGVNNARNFQIQSMAASIVNRAAIEVNKAFKKAGIDGLTCAQIHDQLIFNVDEKNAEEAKEIVKDIMENNIKLSIKLKAPPAIGRNWLEAH